MKTFEVCPNCGNCDFPFNQKIKIVEINLTKHECNICGNVWYTRL